MIVVKLGYELYGASGFYGFPVAEFYQDIVRIPCTDSPYPSAIEEYCKKSDKFVRVEP